MNTTEQQLLDRLLKTFEDWNKDLQAARDDYRKSIEIINKASSALEAQMKTPVQILLQFAPWIFFILLLVVVIIIFSTFKCGTLSFQEFSYSVPCK